MGFFGEFFRVEDWRREPLVTTVPLVTFLVTGILATILLILVEWPSDPWRTLIALLAATASSSAARWILQRSERSPQLTETNLDS